MAEFGTRRSSITRTGTAKGSGGVRMNVTAHIPLPVHTVTVWRERRRERREWHFVYLFESHALVLDLYQEMKRSTGGVFLPVRWCSRHVYGDGTHTHGIKYRDVKVPKAVFDEARASFARALAVEKRGTK